MIDRLKKNICSFASGWGYLKKYKNSTEELNINELNEINWMKWIEWNELLA